MIDSALTWSDFVDGWELFREPVLCAIVAGMTLGFLSAHIVLRRMVFVSAAVTQAAGLGVALAFYSAIHLGFAVDPAYGAVILSLATAAALAFGVERLGLSREAVLGFAFALAGSAAVLVGSRITQEANDIQAILFGTAVLVSPEDLRRVLIAATLVMAFQLWWFRGLSFTSFDPVAARVQGLPVRLLDLTLLLSIGIMVGVSSRALGSLPAFAMSTLPATAALLLSRNRLFLTYVLAAVFGAAAGFLGYFLAFLKEFPVGSSQAMVCVALVVAAALIRLLASVPRTLTAIRARTRVETL